MTIGLVSGTVAAAHREPALEGVTLLAVQELDLTCTPTGVGIIAVDAVGAGKGDVVLIAHGIAALHTDITGSRPADAAIVAIIDRIDLD